MQSLFYSNEEGSIMGATNSAFILANIDRYVKTVGSNLEEGLDRAGFEGVKIVKENTPVDSGRLMNSMAHATRKGVKGGGTGEDTIKAPSQDDVVVVGTNVIYGPSVEYLSKKNKGFMLRSFYQWKPIAAKVIADAIKRGK